LPAPGAILQAANYPKRRSSKRSAGQRKSRGIGKVKEFGSDLEMLAFGDVDLFCEAKVDIVDPGDPAVREIAGRIAGRLIGRVAKVIHVKVVGPRIPIDNCVVAIARARITLRNCHSLGSGSGW
jgi:hypothetical protein